jgi:hypothetical protein
MKKIALSTLADAYVCKEAEARPCGECTTCCTALGVEELHKRNYEPCPHLRPEGGCGIYLERPYSCRAFNCWWRVGLVSGSRPDKSGIVVDSSMVNDKEAVVRVWEVKPGALRWASNRKIIAKLKKKYGLVITGTKETWGTIWIEDAPEAVREEIERQRQANSRMAQKVCKEIDNRP